MSPRPKNIRKINTPPIVSGFKPLYDEKDDVDIVFLHFEEFEAIRLCDYEGKTQQEASVWMEVSRPTLSRIYTRARLKIAEALVRGATLLIEGGTSYTESRWFRCQQCGLVFNNIYPAIEGKTMCCMRCGTVNIESIKDHINIIKTENIMVKIAVPTRESRVDDHFGHCEFYTIFTIGQDNQILSTESIPSPQGCGCKSNIASQLEEMGVSVMLAGNMGTGALNVLTAHHIQVLRGCSGNIMDVVTAYLKGDLKDSGEGCHHHGADGHTCNHHHE